MSETFLKAQTEARARAWEAAKSLLDNAAAEKRDLTAEEQVQFDRINADLDERAAVIENIKIPELKQRITKIIADKLGVKLGFDL